MRESIRPNERRLLRVLQVRLILLYLAAFLTFEVLLSGASYYVLRQHMMTLAFTTIEHEWQQKTPQAVDKLLSSQFIGQIPRVGRSPLVPLPSSNNQVELVATWLVSKSGQVITRDMVLANSKNSIYPLFTRLIENHIVNSFADGWSVQRIEQTRVLVGIHPIRNSGTLLGFFITAYSLQPLRETMHTLLAVDVELGLGSILLLLPLTYLLSRRSVSPIRGALRRQRDFVNDAAHELRTPLSILRGTLELARTEVDSHELQEAMDESLEQTDYLTRLVGDLSTLARIESGSTLADIQPVDVAQILRQATEQVSRLTDSKNILWTCTGCQESLILSGDPMRLRELFLILLDNAVKYNRPGGQVSVTLRREWRSAIIQVADTGIGIPPADLPHIFDRFYRSDVASHRAPGSGIGLAIAASIITVHKGHMDVHSTLNQGTTFTVRLPRHSVRPRDPNL